MVGDRVEIASCPTLGTRRSRTPRRGILLRGAFRNEEKIVAANVDVLVIGPFSEPPLRTGLIDRYLVAAWRGGIESCRAHEVDLPNDEGEVVRVRVDPWGAGHTM